MTDLEKIAALTAQIKDATIAAHKANSHAAAVKHLNASYRLARLRSILIERNA